MLEAVTARLLSQGPVVVYVTDSDLTAPPRFVSANIARLVGHGPEALQAGHIRLWDLIHDADRPTVLALARAAATSGALSLPDYRLRRMDGLEIWVSHTLDRAPDGLYLHYLQDITTRKRVEQDLAFHKERLELVIEGGQLGIWDWNPQTEELRFNERWIEMLGQRLDEVEPHYLSWESRVHPDDLAGCFADIQAHIDGRVPFYQNVHRMRHKDGHWVYILDRGKIMARDQQGRPIRFTGTHVDITREKQAELAAMAASEAKSYFLANMSHEIRTPLNGILGVTNLLAESIRDPEQHRYIRAVQECGESLLVIINDLLDFSKIEAGELRLSPVDFDLHRLIESVALLFHERALSKKLRFEYALGPGVPRLVSADETRLRQVISNLVSNAIKFTEHGQVQVSVELGAERPEGWELVFCIADTGIGIDPADQHRIFERFMQTAEGAQRRFGGTGLGLSISKLLVELFGGRIWVESQRGAGSRFFFTIRAARPMELVQHEERALPMLGKVRVLVAEDNHVSQLVIAKTLERLGAEYLVVDNGKHALDAVRTNGFDVVLLDLHMPELDGLEATRILRGELGRSCPPILGLTADAFRETRHACLQAGMSGCIIKPFRREDIAEALALALQGPVAA